MVEYKYNIIKEVLNKNKIPIDIQEMIVDKLVPEHQKINLVDEYKKDRPWDEDSEEYQNYLMDRPLSTRFNLSSGWKNYFKEDVEATYIKKVNFDDYYDTQHTNYLEFDGEERQLLNTCYDEDIYNYFSQFFSPEDFMDWVVDNMLEKKKFYEITTRHRYSFYKLFQDPSYKYRYSDNMIFTIDKYYEDKKNKYRNNYSIN